MMRTDDRYVFDVVESGEQRLAVKAEGGLDAVWRFDFSAPGFCLLDLGLAVDSHELRALMLRLREQLSEVGSRTYGVRFVYRSLGRFDQQETTRFHLDGAPDQSLLMLGYEPSKVHSRLSLADYSRCAYDLGTEPKRFLDEFNPMYRKGEQLLGRYVTHLPQPEENHSRILLINNSSLPYTETRTNPLGVLHKAEIVNPDESEQRIVSDRRLKATALPLARFSFREDSESSGDFWGRLTWFRPFGPSPASRTGDVRWPFQPFPRGVPYGHLRFA